MADILGDQVTQVLDAAGAVQALDEGAQLRREHIEADPHRGGVDLLQFQHHEVVDPVRGDLVGQARGVGGQRHGPEVGRAGLRAGLVEMAPDDNGEVRKGRVEGRADGGLDRRVRAGLHDREASRLEGEQEAVRLHASDDVDRLAVARGQVNPGRRVIRWLQTDIPPCDGRSGTVPSNDH